MILNHPRRWVWGEPNIVHAARAVALAQDERPGSGLVKIE
jgi:hypothetical protein